MQTLLFLDVAGCRTSGRAPDVVSAGMVLLRERIATLTGLVRAGRVQVKVGDGLHSVHCWCWQHGRALCAMFCAAAAAAFDSSSHAKAIRGSL
jgi:hypothetical protein